MSYYLPQPPREWSRVQNSCSLVNDANNNGFVKLPYSNKLIPSPLVAYNLQMLTKGNILQYKKNSGSLTKAQRYSKIARGQWTNRNTTWASQSTNGITNPNTSSLKRIGSNNIALDPITGQVLGPTLLPLTCPQPIINNYPNLPDNTQSSISEPPVPPPPPPVPPSGPTVPPVPQLPDIIPIVIPDNGNLICSIQENICTGDIQTYKANQICNLTTDSDVPGRIEPLCWNDGTPTWYPRQRYTMTNSGNKWPYTSGNPKPVLNSAIKLVPPTVSLQETNTCNNIILNWTYTDSICLSIDKFYVYKNDILFSIVPKNINTININDLLFGESYTFYVTSVNTNIESDKSNIINFVPTITYTATGNYTIYNNNGYTGIVFEYPSGTITFNCNYKINLLLVGGGGGGGGTTFFSGGGGGGGIYLNNNFQLDTNTYNINIGNGGNGYTTGVTQGPGGNTTITNGIINYFANGGGISYTDSSGTYGGIGGNSSDGFSTGGNGGNYLPLTNGQNSSYISTILPFTIITTTLYLSGGGGSYFSNYAGLAGKGFGGLTSNILGVIGQSATQSISGGGYGGGGGSGSVTGGNGGNGVAIVWWKN
jgi:hypothetical protein